MGSEWFSGVCRQFRCALLLAAVMASAEENLLTFGDFEPAPGAALTSGQLPPGWRKPFGTAAVLQVVEEARPGSAGTHCLQLAMSETAPTAGAYSELIPLQPDQGLLVRGWMKPGDAERQLKGLYFGVGWYDAQQQPIIVVPDTQVNYTYVNKRRPEGDWYARELLLTPSPETKERYGNEIPPNAAYFDIRVFALNYPASAWYDDLEAVQVSAEELAQMTAAAAPKPVQRAQPAPPPEAQWVVAYLGEREVESAAAEMATYLSRVLVQEIVAVPWQPLSVPHVFLLTDGEHAPAPVRSRLAGLARDAFVIQSPAPFDGREVCLLVAQDQYGADYPAYYFLTEFMDVHWVGPGELGEVLTAQPQWALPARIDVVESPDFEMRLWSGNSFRSRKWLARSSRMGFHHALGHIFDPNKHGDQPEVYPLVDGKRYIPEVKPGGHSLSGWQPCTSSPASLEIATQAVLDGLASGKQMTVSLSVNDGAGNFCTCAGCLAQDAKDSFVEGQRPNLSDRFCRFYNEVIDRARKVNPQAQIAVLGYGAVKTPPKESRVHEGINVFQVQPDLAALKAWRAAGATPNLYLWLWDGGFLTVRPDPQTIAELVKEGRQLGAIGLYSEIVPHWIVSAPKFYTLAKILWDTSRDVDEVQAEYFRLAYGAAAGPLVHAFFNHWYEIYRRRPANELHETAWGWRTAEQFKYLTRVDLATLDARLAAAAAAPQSESEAARFAYLEIFYKLMRINAEEYLLGTELSDADRLAAMASEEIIAAAAAGVPLTAEFDRLWTTQVAADKSGWLLDEIHQQDPDKFWSQMVGQMRTLVSSACETSIDSAIAQVTERLIADRGKAGAIKALEAQQQAYPQLAPFIGPQGNALRGVALSDAIVNGGFEDGQPGDPPRLPGWDYYEFYGMVKGMKSTYSWTPGSGRDGGYAIGFGDGRYPEMKSVIQLEEGGRYALSFWYKTVGRDRDASFTIFGYDGELESPREIDNQKVVRFAAITLPPTNGEWRHIQRTLRATRSGTHIVQLAVYYQQQGWWVWFDELTMPRVW